MWYKDLQKHGLFLLYVRGDGTCLKRGGGKTASLISSMRFHWKEELGMANIPVCTSFMKNGGTGPPWSPWFRRPCKCSGSICTDIFKNSSPLMVNKYTESTLSVYKLTDINFSQFMYWLLNEYPSVYLLAIKSISVSLCTGYYTNRLWHIHSRGEYKSRIQTSNKPL